MNNTHPVLRVLTLGEFLAEYQGKALATIVDLPPVAQLIHCATGLTEEAGELLGIYKKVAFFGQALDRNKLIGELGDQLYYAVALIDAFNISIEEAVQLEPLHGLISMVAEGRENYLASLDTKDSASLMRPQVFMNITCATETLNLANALALAWTNDVEPSDQTASQFGAALNNIIAIIGIVSSVAHDILGMTIEDIAAANLAKLSARFPDGKFDQAASANRNTEAEAAAIASAA